MSDLADSIVTRDQCVAIAKAAATAAVGKATITLLILVLAIGTAGVAGALISRVRVVEPASHEQPLLRPHLRPNGNTGNIGDIHETK